MTYVITYDHAAGTKTHPDGRVEKLTPAETIPPKLRKARRGCSGCGTRHVVRWMGVRWYGKPWPQRWRMDGLRPVYVKAHGCGCILKLKNLVPMAGRIRAAVSWWWRS